MTDRIRYRDTLWHIGVCKQPCGCLVNDGEFIAINIYWMTILSSIDNRRLLK
jgi:hypothetical protein